LQKYKIIQPFKTSIRLDKNQKITNENNLAWGAVNGTRNLSVSYCQKIGIVCDSTPSAGFAWVIRRGIIDELKFFDKMILGGGDYMMVSEFCHNSGIPISKHFRITEKKLQEITKEWANKAHKLIDGYVGCVDSTLLHLYHGKIEDRQYNKRYESIQNYNFSVDDIKLNEDGCWEWDTDKTGLKIAVENYFGLRNEDDKFISYYQNRKNLIYYKIIKEILYDKMGDLIIDIGAMDTDTVLQGNFNKRIVINLEPVLNQIENVKYVIGDYLNILPLPYADYVLCLQVLEHVKDPKEFAQKLLKQGGTIIVSVPYKWAIGACPWHVQDPVDDEKMYKWFSREPLWSKLVTEGDGIQRKIYFYKGIA